MSIAMSSRFMDHLICSKGFGTTSWLRLPAYHGPVQDPAVQPLRGGKVLHFLSIFQHVWSMSRRSVAIDLRKASQKVHQANGDRNATTSKTSDDDFLSQVLKYYVAQDNEL